MAEDLTGIRVFIATPGGLEEERKRFREALEEFNRIDAFERGRVFIPVGWELTTPGLGRPQELINDEVRRCDYMVLVLHDRWGTPPASEGRFTSGTEEEYNVARECAGDGSKPMRNVAVMFKGVDAARMSDPGEQLKKVLAFRQRLEEERGLLFGTFDSVAEFEREVRGLLLKWMRDDGREKGDTAVVPPPSQPPAGETPAAEDLPADVDLLERAAQLADDGRLTQAESLYARAVVGRTDLDALTQYARFLRRVGRLDQAVAVSDRLYELASQRGDGAHMIEALSNRAIVRRKRSEFGRATRDLEEAIDLARAAGPEELSDLAFVLDNLGLTLRKQGQFDDALARHREALDIKRRLDDRRSVATTLHHTAALLRQQGDLDEAREMTEEAVRVFEELEYPRGEAQARANLGELLEAAEDLDGAEREFLASLEINERLNSPEGVGMNLWQLGRIAFERGDLAQAREYAGNAYTRSGEQKTERPEAIGTPMQLMGNIELAEGNVDDAILDLEGAANIFRRNGHPLGAAWSLSDLARAYKASGNEDAAARALLQAEKVGGGLDHAKFRAALDEARTVVRSD